MAAIRRELALAGFARAPRPSRNLSVHTPACLHPLVQQEPGRTHRANTPIQGTKEAASPRSSNPFKDPPNHSYGTERQPQDAEPRHMSRPRKEARARLSHGVPLRSKRRALIICSKSGWVACASSGPTRRREATSPFQLRFGGVCGYQLPGHSTNTSGLENGAHPSARVCTEAAL